MMRGRRNWAVAVRKGDGSVHVEAHDLRLAAEDKPWLGKPVIRGVWGFYETLVLAMKAFQVSAEQAGETEEEQLSSREVGISMVLGLALAVLLFIVIPAVLTNVLVGPAIERPLAWNVVDGALRVAAFFAYIWAVSRVPDIQRVFAYHGAEHKTIHTFERGLPLSPGVIQGHTTKHVRCGTSFLLMVMVVALVVFSLVPVRTILEALGVTHRLGSLGLNILIRIALLPLVAGLAYEVVRWAGKRPDDPFVRVLLWPGLQLQRMTTREPDDSMVEVAVVAMEAVALREGLLPPGEGTAEAAGDAPSTVLADEPPPT
ncbi:MAG: DUF1385 domain-containing protein [Coriobacteriia bacterium]|nr:DUF1385 domain-containing protein [Coriobacteriia bacterium]